MTGGYGQTIANRRGFEAALAGKRMLTKPTLSALESAIDLSTWKRDEDFEYHPIGSKPKRNYICPLDTTHPLLIPGHTYLFKVAQGWQAGQMWSEAIAYQLGAGAGLDVPPCFLAFDPAAEEWGALIEFFVGYPGENAPSRLIHGADLLQGRGFTAGADRPHNLGVNIEVCQSLGVCATERWWSALVAFDTLIGNTDRHTQNWGLLLDVKNVPRMAPVFDNGTSLGYMQSDARLAAFSGNKLDQFIAKGNHHMSWDLANETRTCHMDLCRQMMSSSETSGAIVSDVIHGALLQLDGVLSACALLPVNPAFTLERVEFVSRLLSRRGEMMMSLLKGL